MLPENLLLLPLLKLSLSPPIKWYVDSYFCLVSNRINYFIFYVLNTWSRALNYDFNLKYCLFGGIQLAKNADSEKYVHSGYGIVVQNFHYLTLAWVNISLFLKLI